jgi:mRNA interferase HigB
MLVRIGAVISQLRKTQPCSHFGNALYQPMQIVAKKALRDFWDKHNQAEAPLTAWYLSVGKANWTSPADIKASFGTTVDFVGDNRVIFDIGGNKYRLIVHVAYKFHRVLIKFVGTHQEYDRIDPEKV